MTSAIDFIHSERGSTSTSSFFVQRLAYSSHVSMIMPKFLCHLYETGSLFFLGHCSKRFLSFILRTIVRSLVTTWPHGAYRNCESEQLQGRGILGKTFKVELLQSCFVIEDSGSNRSGIAIENAWRLLVMKVRRDFVLDGLLIQNVANIQSVNAFICEVDIQKRALPCFCRFINPYSFEYSV